MDWLISMWYEMKQAFPLENAATFGVVLFALSWLVPRRIITLPSEGIRRTLVLWGGLVGGILVAVTATVMSAIRISSTDLSGFDGWWRRPAPLIVATVVVIIMWGVLRREQVPPPGTRAIAPRRSWYVFASVPLLGAAGIVSAVLLLTAMWHSMIGTAAPREGFFLGEVPEHSEQAIYMSFNNGFGFVAGAGWLNHWGTIFAVLVAAIVLILVLRADANVPAYAVNSASSVKHNRSAVAICMQLLLFAGALATLGAVWMHVGTVGGAMVGLEDPTMSPQVPLFITGSYHAVAQPLNLAGYLLQAAGWALALRIAVDAVRAARDSRATGTQTSVNEPSREQVQV